MAHYMAINKSGITMYFDEVPYLGKIKKCIF